MTSLALSLTFVAGCACGWAAASVHVRKARRDAMAFVRAKQIRLSPSEFTVEDRAREFAA